MKNRLYLKKQTLNLLVEKEKQNQTENKKLVFKIKQDRKHKKCLFGFS